MHVGMGAFFQNLAGCSDAEVYSHELSLADLAEPLGFDSVWAPEHHFDEYTMCPNVVQLLTWVGARTRRVRLGSMVVVLPWHDPVRVAEGFSMLDHMTGGRAILGIGRGLARIEFEGFRVAMAESRQRFVEYAEAILRALETGTIECQGEFYRQPPTAIRPAPLRSFRGRSYASAISPESAEIMARLGVGIMIIAQKPWETALAELDQYRCLFREINGAEAPPPLLVSFVAVHEHEAGAKDMYERYLVGYCRSVLRHYEFANARLAEIPGYEYYGRLADNLRRHGEEAFVRFLADLQVWGTPEQAVEKMIQHQRLLGSAGAIAVFSYGGMPHDLARANLRLFAEEVLPRLKAHASDRDVGGESPAPSRRADG
jgi:alkanesulfonate monooxygenase SsuD/methylene tetrahydromethanopterin reductase-like flavin-dependent oxidoreductase (luciferase family)